MTSEIERLAVDIASLPLIDGDDGETPNRVLALETADIMNYEDGQALYRFAVLVTKLIRKG